MSAGFELPCTSGVEIIESGSAWVGASVQRIGIHGHPLRPESTGLAEWDADRYGLLSINDDDASFDIFTQVARAVGRDRAALPTDPMDGLEVAHVVAFGASQSANRLATYYNAIQPETTAFDAFLMLVYSGGGTRVEALGAGPSLALVPAEARAIVNVMPFGSHRLRDDIDARAFVLNSETEAAWYHPVRQPDNDTFRLWEVAGAAHIGVGSGHEVDAQLMTRRRSRARRRPHRPVRAGTQHALRSGRSRTPRCITCAPGCRTAWHRRSRIGSSSWATRRRSRATGTGTPAAAFGSGSSRFRRARTSRVPVGTQFSTSPARARRSRPKRDARCIRIGSCSSSVHMPRSHVRSRGVHISRAM